jgi:hypothetical protein
LNSASARVHQTARSASSRSLALKLIFFDSTRQAASLTFGACTPSPLRRVYPRPPAPWAHQSYPIGRLPGDARKSHC